MKQMMTQRIFMVQSLLYRDNKYYEDDCEDTNQHTKLLYIQRFISFIQKLIIRRIGVSDNKNDEDAYSTLMRI